MAEDEEQGGTGGGAGGGSGSGGGRSGGASSGGGRSGGASSGGGGGAGRIPGSGVVADLVAQLRGITEGLEGLAGLGSRMPISSSALSGLRHLPLPGALSAGQIGTIATTVAAQRRSVQALQAQLTAFDEQLAVLERIIVPLADWSKTWADLEERLVTLGLRAEAQDDAGRAGEGGQSGGAGKSGSPGKLGGAGQAGGAAGRAGKGRAGGDRGGQAR